MHPTQVDSQAPLFKILMTSADGLYHEKNFSMAAPLGQRRASGGDCQGCYL